MDKLRPMTAKTKTSIRKSVRLGWRSREDRDRRPLSERIGEGRVVYASTQKGDFLLVP